MKFKSEVQLEALNNATVDTDKFLVSDSSTVKYRTGAQLLSDLGIADVYVPYTGATGNVDLGTHTLSSYNLIVNHTSGSGVAASITKGGSGEALTINKTSGSGNAMSVTGGLTSLVDLTLSSIANATTDTDRFIVSDGGSIKYRTGEQTLSDLGACKVVNLTVATASATAAKVTTESVTFEEGALYLIKFTPGNSVSSPTLNGINIRLGTTDASTTTFSVGANTIVPMYYNTTNNVMQITGSYRTSDSTEDYNLRWENSVQAGEQITRYKVIMEGIDGKFYPLTIGDTTAATKTVSTQEFRLDGTILVYNTTATVAANAVFTNVYISEYFTTTNYTFNQSSGFTAYRSVYLVGTINSNGNFVLDNTTLTSWLTQTLPTTDDGKVYIYLGITNNTTTAFRLEVTHPIYQYKNGKLGLYSSIENPITGTGTTNYLPKFTGSTALGNSLVYDNGTNVGIGTTSPGAKLHVDNPDTATNQLALRIDQRDPSVAIANFYQAGTETHSFTTTGTNSGVFTMKSGNSNAVSISTSGISYLNGGSVGIGTTSPNTTLEVDGAISTTTSDYVQGSTGSRLLIETPSSGNTHSYIQAQSSGGTTNNEDLAIQLYGGNVGIGTSSPKAKLDVNGRFCVDSKTHNLTNAFTTCLTVNLSSHTGCYVTLTCFGDWGSHSAAAYRGEFFLQNGANGYAEPGIILRQDDNTSNGADQIVCQILDPTGTGNPKDFEIQIRTTATTGTTGFIGQLTYTVQGQFNSIT